MLFSVLLLLSLATTASATTELEKFLARERWIPVSDKGIPIGNLTGVSEHCQKDVLSWIAGLEAFSVDFDLCYVQKSTLCTDKMKADLKENLYALKQLDAFGRIPAGVLDLNFIESGSEYECKEVSKHYVYRTHYCFVNSVPGANGTCGTFPTIRTAVCMPSSCSPEDILLIMGTMNQSPLKYCSADCVAEEGHTNVFFWVFVSFLSVLVGVCILASAVDFIRETYLGLLSSKAEGVGLKMLLAFSFYTNGHSILDTTPAREGHLKSLDCIRFFSMLWVVEGHVAMFFLSNDVLLPVVNITKPILADTIGDAVLSVDTFFTISGLLVSYLFFKQMAKNRKLVKNPVTWVLFYVHRYLRLTPPYMLFICFYIAFVPLMVGQNAMGNQATVDICTKYWWRNLIYINNFDSNETCYGITWYLSADTQMYLVAPLFLVALFISHWVGLAVLLGAMAGSVGLTFFDVYHYGLGAHVLRTGTKGILFMDKLYAMAWIRITPYLVGIYVGYILAHYPKAKAPKVHWVRPSLLSKESLQILPLIGWMFFIAVALAIVYGPHDYLAFETTWSKFVSALYYSMSRIGWGMFVCWVVVANYYGWGAFIASFMDHPLWQPLGRLSYTAYLVHFFLIMYYFNLFDRPLHFTTLLAQFQTYTIPITVLAYVFAFVWSCLCELPFLKLEKMAVDGLIRSRRPEVRPMDAKSKDVENWTVE